MNTQKLSTMRIKTFAISTAITASLAFSLLAFAEQTEWSPLVNSGENAYKTKDYKTALESYEKARDLCQEKNGYEKDLATIYNGIGLAQEGLGDHKKAEEAFLQAIKVKEDASGSTSLELLPYLTNLTRCYSDSDKVDDAIATIERANTILKGTEGKATGANAGRMALNLNILSNLHHKKGDIASAKTDLEQAIELGKEAFGKDAPELAKLQNNLAVLLREQGDSADAEKLYKDSLALREKAEGPDGIGVAASLNNLARVYREQDRFPEAEPLLKRSLAIVMKAPTATPEQRISAHKNLGFLYREMGEPEQAQPLYEQALKLQEAKFGPDDRSIIDTLSDMGQMYQELAVYDKARQSFERAITLCDKAKRPEDDPERLKVSSRLEETYRQDSDFAKAIELNEKTQKMVGGDKVLLAKKLNDLALLYKEQNEFDKAKAAFERALELSGTNTEAGTNYLSNLAHMYAEQGNLPEAKGLYQKLVTERTAIFGKESAEVAAAEANLRSVVDDMTNSSSTQ